VRRDENREGRRGVSARYDVAGRARRRQRHDRVSARRRDDRLRAASGRRPVRWFGGRRDACRETGGGRRQAPRVVPNDDGPDGSGANSVTQLAGVAGDDVLHRRRRQWDPQYAGGIARHTRRGLPDGECRRPDSDGFRKRSLQPKSHLVSP